MRRGQQLLQRKRDELAGGIERRQTALAMLDRALECDHANIARLGIDHLPGDQRRAA